MWVKDKNRYHVIERTMETNSVFENEVDGR
jgi:hypothetical protein